MTKKVLLLLAVQVIAMSAAAAQGSRSTLPSSRGTDEDQRACRNDAVTLCKPYLGDDFAVLSCFQSQRAKLSVACRKVLEKYGQ
jgi:hypothetical protein